MPELTGDTEGLDDEDDPRLEALRDQFRAALPKLPKMLMPTFPMPAMPTIDLGITAAIEEMLQPIRASMVQLSGAARLAEAAVSNPLTQMTIPIYAQLSSAQEVLRQLLEPIASVVEAAGTSPAIRAFVAHELAEPATEAARVVPRLDLKVVPTDVLIAGYVNLGAILVMVLGLGTSIRAVLTAAVVTIGLELKRRYDEGGEH